MKKMVKKWYCEQKYYVWIQQKYWSRLSLLLKFICMSGCLLQDTYLRCFLLCFFSERQCCWVCKRRNRLHSERNGGWKDRIMKDNCTVFLMLLLSWTISGGYFKFSSNDGRFSCSLDTLHLTIFKMKSCNHTAADPNCNGGTWQKVGIYESELLGEKEIEIFFL